VNPDLHTHCNNPDNNCVFSPLHPHPSLKQSMSTRCDGGQLPSAFLTFGAQNFGLGMQCRPPGGFVGVLSSGMYPGTQ
jgi:hypothetical protein